MMKKQFCSMNSRWSFRWAGSGEGGFCQVELESLKVIESKQVAITTKVLAAITNNSTTITKVQVIIMQVVVNEFQFKQLQATDFMETFIKFGLEQSGVECLHFFILHGHATTSQAAITEVDCTTATAAEEDKQDQQDESVQQSVTNLRDGREEVLNFVGSIGVDKEEGVAIGRREAARGSEGAGDVEGADVGSRVMVA